MRPCNIRERPTVIHLRIGLKTAYIKEAPKEAPIILDNAMFHKKTVLPRLAQAAGCAILFLSPYSPYLNPIEKKWAGLKNAAHDSSVSLPRLIMLCTPYFIMRDGCC